MKASSLLEGVLLGAAAMYFFDPDRGARRRAVARDRALHAARVKRDAANVMVQDFRNRSRGTVHEIRHRFDHEMPADDVLIARIRSALGRACSNQSSLGISVAGGAVTLTGPVPANEVQCVIRTVRGVPGVMRVENEMEMLQGAAAEIHRRPINGNGRMTPGACLLLGAAGGVMTLIGLARRGTVGGMAFAMGLGMVSKAFSDTEHRFEPATPSVGRPRRRADRRNGHARSDGEYEETLPPMGLGLAQ